MARSVNEVLIGPGTLYTAAKGTAFPADPSIAPAVAWSDIGYSEEGWSFNTDRSFEDIPVAEEIDPIKILQSAREMHLVGASAQAIIENLKIALGGGTITTIAGPPAAKKFEPAEITDAPVEYALLLRVNGPEVAGVVKKRDIQVPRALSVGAIEMAHRKAPDKTLLAMDFRLIKPDTGKIFTILELT